MLLNIVSNETILKDSFDFVEELKGLSNSAPICQMASFDIESLYTNISLDETTPPTIERKDIKNRLEYFTKNSHFLFNGKVYKQIDRVWMGSPLAPLLTEIFL